MEIKGKRKKKLLEKAIEIKYIIVSVCSNARKKNFFL